MEKLRQRLHDLERQLEEDRLTAQRTEHKLLEKLEKETRQRLDMEEEVNEKDRALEALVAQQECAARFLNLFGPSRCLKILFYCVMYCPEIIMARCLSYLGLCLRCVRESRVAC